MFRRDNPRFLLSSVGNSLPLCLMFGISLRVAEHMDVCIRTHLIMTVLSFVQLLMKRITLDRYQERWALERGEGLKLT